MAQLDRRKQHPVEGDEHRDLHQDRKAAAQGVDLLRLVELHHRLVHLLPVIAVHLPDLGEPRRDELHLRHRLVARRREREEDELDEHREEDDRDAPVASERMQMLEQPEERPGDDRQPAIVDHQIQPGRGGL